MEEKEKGTLYNSLRLAVEQRFGKRAVVTSDFAELSARILADVSIYWLTC